MGTDLLRFESNERIDASDFQFLVDESIQNNSRQHLDQFAVDPAKQRMWVIDGFALAATGGGTQVQVTRGRAILGRREGAQIFYGALTTEGDTTKVIDITSYANGTYNIYIRFEYLDGDTESRIFWNSAGNGSEFAQSIATRRKANWSLRIESAPPGNEWFKIGEVDVLAAVINVLRDLRSMYFEGDVNYEVYPTPGSLGVEYQSGWSTDGGGGANDRNVDRQQYGVKDMQTFISSMRQCIEDIRGRGLRNWWDRSIGGLVVGYDANPVEDVISLGDANMLWGFDGGTAPYLQFDSGDFIDFTRASNRFRIFAGGLEQMSIFDTVGVRMGQLNVGGTATPGAGYAIVSNGLVVGFDSAPVDNQISIGDAQFYLNANTGSSAPFINFETDSYIQYNRTSNYYGWFIGAVEEMRLGGPGLQIANGLYVGAVGTSPTDNDITVEGGINCGGTTDPGVGDGIFTNGIRVGQDLAAVAGRVIVGNGDFYLSWNGTDGFLNFDANDYLQFDRDLNTSGTYRWIIGALDEMRLFSGGLAIANGLYVGSATGAPLDNDIIAEGGINCGGATDPAVGDGIFTNGLVVGFDGAPAADELQIGSSVQKWKSWVSGDVDLYFDSATSDRIHYDHANKTIDVYSAGAGDKVCSFLGANGSGFQLLWMAPSTQQGMMLLDSNGGTLHPGATTNHAKLYARYDGVNTRLYAITTGAGPTLLSPHNDRGEWIFHNVNYMRGIEITVEMEELVKEVERLSGKKFFQTKPIPQEEIDAYYEKSFDDRGQLQQ